MAEQTVYKYLEDCQAEATAAVLVAVCALTATIYVDEARLCAGNARQLQKLSTHLYARAKLKSARVIKCLQDCACGVGVVKPAPWPPRSLR